MKKVVGFVILVTVMIFSLAMPAMAGTTTHHVDEINMNIDLPDDGYIYTQEIPADHPALDYFNMTQEELQNYMINGDNYIEYISTDPYFEIGVYTAENIYDLGFENYNDATDFEKEIMISESEIGFTSVLDEPYDISFTGITINDIYWIEINGWLESYDGKTYIDAFDTLIDNQDIYIYSYAYDEDGYNAMIAMMPQVINSIEFTGAIEISNNQKDQISLKDLIDSEEPLTEEDVDDVVAAITDSEFGNSFFSTLERMFLPVIIVLVVLVVGAIVLVIVLVTRNNRKSKQQQTDYQEQSNVSNTIPPQTDTQANPSQSNLEISDNQTDVSDTNSVDND